MAMTLAKIGRSMKNCENIRTSAAREGSGPGGGLGVACLRADLAARAGLLQALDDEPLPRPQALLDDAPAAHLRPQLDGPALDRVVRAEHQEVIALLVGGEGTLGDEQRVLVDAD